MATGTAALAPMRTVRRKIAARADVDQRIEAIGAEAAAEPDSVVGRPTGGQFPEDPFASLRGVAGWAVDYVTFLREPIDQLQGDPQSVQATVDAIRSGAERMRELASTQRDTLAKPQGWTGKAQEAYQTSMDALGGELDSLAGAMAAKGVVVENSGAMVRALREALLHTVGQYSHSLVPGAISAYVFAPITFGASIAMFLASVVDSATQLGTSIAAKMDDLNATLTRQVDRVKQLDEIADEVGRGWERFEAASSGGTEATPAHTASRRLLREGETAQEQLRPMQATRAMAVEETEALRPVHAVAGERLTGRLLPEEPTHFARAEEPVQARHAVQAEPMMRTAHVQAEPMMRTAHVQAEPMMRAAHVQAEPMMRAAHVQAEPMMRAAHVQAEPMMRAAHVQAEPMMRAAHVQAEPMMRAAHVQAEPMMRAAHVQAEPMMRAAHVQAEPMMRAAHVQAEPMMRAAHVQAEPMMRAAHVQAEPMMRAAHVQAEPMMRAAHVQAEPMVQATRLEAPVQYERAVRATEPVTHFRAAEQAEARAVTATHHATVRRVEETE
ncbi:hypothetical protein [Saccharothrix texasensis]|uniref:Uncharacterized protein n=1 Tax=Saccharothrix texasensis TaxID=103734 RepID=A0A3N1H1D9_9PSEU|nr:hypothetical protein [Saccharothrix texasensis]ROP36082.1 hypothetical protein EDD40_1344 [Saccharothrix texasensis]